MIVYKNSTAGFKEEVDTNVLVEQVESAFIQNLGWRLSESEKQAIQNSMQYVERAVRRSNMPDDCGVLIEYTLPGTSRRVDLILTGKDNNNSENLLIVELKQWQEATKTEKDGVVETFLGGRQRETVHPSYQAFSYKTFLNDFNEEVHTGNITAHSCAFLHNMPASAADDLTDKFYSNYLSDSPIYFKEDIDKLGENFLRLFENGDGEEIATRVEKSKLKPSRKLIDHVTSMLDGHDEFTLLDSQKVALETALQHVGKDKKTVIIIEGGPGTGKSVISVNLLGRILQQELHGAFVAPNSSFRTVVSETLQKNSTKSNQSIRNLFKGSSVFLDCDEDSYDVLIVDEAHRLKNNKAFMYQGQNQVEDIIKSAKTTIFFIDDNQKIRPEDIGSVDEIKRVAKYYGAHVEQLELTSQFRCNGAEGFLSWLDDVWHFEHTGNYMGWDEYAFEFRLYDNPNELRDAIFAKSNEGYKARLLAGYAWQWSTDKQGNSDGQIEDIIIQEHDFSMPWNSRKVGTTWAMDPAGVKQVGCIHTSQGLEFDYVGVIIGNDIGFNPETMEYFVRWDEYYDRKGKQGLRDDPDKLTHLVKSIYKTLMTRGMKGCYVYVADRELHRYLAKRR